MVHTVPAAVLGSVLGTVVGFGTLVHLGVSGGGLDAWLTLVSTSVAGSLTAAPLGIFTGVTGGIIGGLVGAGFVLVPLPSWLLLHVPIGAFLTKVLVAAIVASLVPLVFPH